MAGARDIRAGCAYIELMLRQSALEKGLRSAQKRIQNFARSVTAAGKAMLGLSAAAAAPFALATKGFSDFDDAMRMAQAVTGATGVEFQRLTDLAAKLGRETSFTAKQVAEGMVSLGRMGFKPAEIEAAIPAVLNLSRATGTELSEAAEIAANNLRVFGKSASEMTNVADLLTATANGSAQTLTDLAEGFKMAGPQAAAAGESMENVAASLGVLANMGIKGSLAGTALRKAFSQFAKSDVQQKLSEIGISALDANGNLRPMPSLMAEIAKAMASMPTGQKLAFAEEIFDLRGALAGLQLGGNIQQLEAFIQKLQNCKGAAAETAKQMDAGIGGAFRRMWSAIEGVQLALGKIVSEAIAPYVEWISRTANEAAKWIAQHSELVKKILAGIAAFAAAGAALLALGAAFKVVAFAVGTLATLFAILKAIILAPIAAVKMIIAAYHTMVTVMAVVRAAAIAMWSSINVPALLTAAALAAVVAVVWKLTGAWDICKNAFASIGSDFGNAFRQIGEIFSTTWQAVKTAIASDDLAGAAKVALLALKVAWLTGIQPLKTAWADLKNFLIDNWDICVNRISKGFTTFGYALRIDFKFLGQKLAEAWSAVWDGIVDLFEQTMLDLKRAWIRTKGLFSSDEEVQSQLDAADQEYAKGVMERQAARENQKAQHKSEIKNLKAEWATAEQMADQELVDKIAQNHAERNAEVAGEKAAIDKARAEWKAAVDAINHPPKTEEKQAVQPKIEETKKAAAEGTAAAAGRMGGTAIGSWSLSQLEQMLGSSAQERTANATEKIAQNTQKTNDELRKLKSGGAALAYA